MDLNGYFLIGVLILRYLSIQKQLQNRDDPTYPSPSFSIGNVQTFKGLAPCHNPHSDTDRAERQSASTSTRIPYVVLYTPLLSSCPQHPHFP